MLKNIVPLLLLIPAFGSPAMADPGPGGWWQRESLSGDWGGRRSALQERGVGLGLVYTGEISHNAAGGIRRGTEYLDNLDITVEMDADRLFGWRGAGFFLYILGNQGGSPSDNAGDLQTASNLDAADTIKVYEAWYQQNLFAERLSLKLGLYDLNSEFDVIEIAGLFFNSSFGIGPDYAQSGLNGPSIFPTTSAGLRIGYRPTDHIYFQVAALDGVPGDPNDETGTHVRFADGDGLLLAAEAGYVAGVEPGAEGPYRKLALGFWRYTERFDDQLIVDGAGDPVRRSGNQGFYLLGEYQLFREAEHPGQGLAVFARYGMAADDINQFDSYLGAGMVYTGPLPGRDADQLGVAVAIVSNSKKFEQAQSAAAIPVDGEEIALELSYRVVIAPWFSVQPDLQWVINPGTDPYLDDALLVGIRFDVAL